MGTVYEAVDEKTKNTVALKILKVNDEDFAARLRDEGKAAAKIKHPNLVNVLDMGEDPNHGSYLVFEFLSGSTLTSLFKERAPMSLKDALELFGRNLCEALAALHHKGVIHRDVKPENMLSDDKDVFKLSDLGLALFSGREAKTATGGVVGTPGYLAPEAFAQKSSAIGPQFDVYSAAAIFVEALTGKPPFGYGNPMEIIKRQMSQKLDVNELARRGLSLPIAKVLSRALSREPKNRPRDTSQLLEELINADSNFEGAVGVTVELTKPAPLKETKNNNRPIYSLLLVFIFVTAFLALVLYNSKGPKVEREAIPATLVQKRDKLVSRAEKLSQMRLLENLNELRSFINETVDFADECKKHGTIATMKEFAKIVGPARGKPLAPIIKSFAEFRLGRYKEADKEVRAALLETREAALKSHLVKEHLAIRLDAYLLQHLQKIQLKKIQKKENIDLTAFTQDVISALRFAIALPINIHANKELRSYRLYLYEWVIKIDSLSGNNEIELQRAPDKKKLKNLLNRFKALDEKHIAIFGEVAKEIAQKSTKLLWNICLYSDSLTPKDSERYDVANCLCDTVRIHKSDDVGDNEITKQWGKILPTPLITCLYLVQIREMTRDFLQMDKDFRERTIVPKYVSVVLSPLLREKSLLTEDDAIAFKIVSQNIPKEHFLKYVTKALWNDVLNNKDEAAKLYGKGLNMLKMKMPKLREEHYQNGFFIPTRIALRRWTLLRELNKEAETEEDKKWFRENLKGWQTKLGVRFFDNDLEKLKDHLGINIRQ